MQTLNQLKRRAAKHDMTIRKNGEDYMIVDIHTNGLLSHPQSISLKAVEEWLDDLENQSEDAAE